MSPSGIEAFQRKSAAKESAKAQYSGGGIDADFFKISANQYAVVRFLEQGEELTFSDVHRVPVEGRRYPQPFICLDANDDGTPCPACQSEDSDISKKITRGYVNLIWRDGPVYARTDKGWIERDKNTKQPVITGRADGVFLWDCSWSVLTELNEKDKTYKGLMSRDFVVKRTGSTMNDTKYHIDPADVDSGPQPMLIADMQLAEAKSDLRKIITPLSYDDFAAVLFTRSAPGGPQPTTDRSSMVPTAGSAFPQGSQPSIPAGAFTRG